MSNILPSSFKAGFDLWPESAALQPTAVKIALLHLPSNHHAARHLPRTNAATHATSQGTRPEWTYASWWIRRSHKGCDTTSSLPDLQLQQVAISGCPQQAEGVVAGAGSEALQQQRRQHGCGQLRLPPRAAEQRRSVWLGSGSRPGLGSEQRTPHDSAPGGGVVGDTSLAAPTLSPEEVAAKAKAAAKERYLKAYADPAGKHVAAQIPADIGALRPSWAGVGEGTPLGQIERARSHAKHRVRTQQQQQQQQQQTGVAAAKTATLAAPTLSPEEVAAKAVAKERYLKAYADPVGKHVATQLPADTGAPSAALPSEATAALVAPDAARLRNGDWGGFGAAGAAGAAGTAGGTAEGGTGLSGISLSDGSVTPDCLASAIASRESSAANGLTAATLESSHTEGRSHTQRAPAPAPAPAPALSPPV